MLTAIDDKDLVYETQYTNADTTEPEPPIIIAPSAPTLDLTPARAPVRARAPARAAAKSKTVYWTDILFESFAASVITANVDTKIQDSWVVRFLEVLAIVPNSETVTQYKYADTVAKSSLSMINLLARSFSLKNNNKALYVSANLAKDYVKYEFGMLLLVAIAGAVAYPYLLSFASGFYIVAGIVAIAIAAGFLIAKKYDTEDQRLMIFIIKAALIYPWQFLMFTLAFVFTVLIKSILFAANILVYSLAMLISPFTSEDSEFVTVEIFQIAAINKRHDGNDFSYVAQMIIVLASAGLFALLVTQGVAFFGGLSVLVGVMSGLVVLSLLVNIINKKQNFYDKQLGNALGTILSLGLLVAALYVAGFLSTPTFSIFMLAFGVVSFSLLWLRAPIFRAGLAKIVLGCKNKPVVMLAMLVSVFIPTLLFIFGVIDLMALGLVLGGAVMVCLATAFYFGDTGSFTTVDPVLSAELRDPLLDSNGSDETRQHVIYMQPIGADKEKDEEPKYYYGAEPKQV